MTDQTKLGALQELFEWIENLANQNPGGIDPDTREDDTEIKDWTIHLSSLIWLAARKGQAMIEKEIRSNSSGSGDI